MSHSTPGAAPRRLGDFEIVHELGRGGMGVVYEAVQTSLGRRVALKVLGPGLGLTPQAVVRFRREAAAAAKLHHTNIVPVYAPGDENGTHFYAMELIEGPSLDRVLKQLREASRERERPESARTPVAHAPGSPTDTVAYGGPEPAAEAAGLSTSALSSGGQYFDAVARMVAGVADALDYAHKQGVIHRDIKPANLLLSPDGRLSLNDFGLARVLEEPGMTQTGEFLGTPAYMSPEQITSGRVPTDHRTDIYSLGATLYELLTLRPPFPGVSRDQVLTQVLHKEPARPRKLNPRVPVDLETICLKCLEKDPDRRYATAGALADDLRRFVNRFAIAAKRSGPVARLVKWGKRKPGLAAALGGLLVALVAVGLFAWALRQEGQRRRNELQQAEQQRRDEQRRAALDKALTSALAGDFPGATQAIAEVELLGAENWEVRLLNGYLKLHTGHAQEAVADLQQAVKLNEDSVMACALLWYAYRYRGDWARAEETFLKLDSLSPRTPEDLLFKGYALANFSLEGGLPLMSLAMRQRPSNIAYLLRAEALYMQAFQTATVADAEAAVKDAEMAKQLIPDNPVALWTSLRAQMVAATAYRTHGLADQHVAALVQAERDAEALKHFPHEPRAVSRRFSLRQYRDYLDGRLTDMVDDLREARKRTANGLIVHLEALNLYQLGRDREALKVLDDNRGGSIADFFRVCLLRELYDDKVRALAALDEIAVREDDSVMWRPRQNCLLLIGELRIASAEARKFRDTGQRIRLLTGQVGHVYLNYLADDGRATETDLLSAIEGRRGSECEVCYTIGLRHLAAGDREGAKVFFRRAADTLVFYSSSWDYSFTFLARMERDSTWPPWIPVKK